jgi:hypothetical protein
MITRDNIKSVFDSVSESDIDEVMDSSNDYVLLHLDGYGNVSVQSVSDVDSAMAESNGDLVCDKDDLLRLFVESGSDNKFVKRYI